MILFLYINQGFRSFLSFFTLIEWHSNNQNLWWLLNFWIHINSKSFANALKSDNYLSCMYVSSILHQPNALPSAESEFTICYRNVQWGSAQNTLNMCWHIIGTLAIVLVETFSLGHNFIKCHFHVFLHSRIIVFTESEPCRCMW